MDTQLVVSLAVSLSVLVGAAVVARLVLQRTTVSAADRPVNGARLTSAHLLHLDSPPWRIVIEIDHPELPDIDQVVIGPCGVLAISTSLDERPSLDQPADDDPNGAKAAAAAAITRGPVDDLLAPVGMACHRLLHVYWGAPQPERPSGEAVVHAADAVDGRRLNHWLNFLATDHRVFDTAQIDLAWQTVVTGIGRPDPLID